MTPPTLQLSASNSWCRQWRARKCPFCFAQKYSYADTAHGGDLDSKRRMDIDYSQLTQKIFEFLDVYQDICYLQLTGGEPIKTFSELTEIIQTARAYGYQPSRARARDTERAIRRSHNDNEVRVIGIGPAGENLVRSACIISDKSKAAGGSGVGAVMGSKNLKAIAARGSLQITVAQPERFIEAVDRARREVEWFPKASTL